MFPVQFIFLNVEPAIYLAESKGGWVRIAYFIDIVYRKFCKKGDACRHGQNF